MKENITGTFPTIAEKGLQYYAENVTKRYELIDRILQSVREGNEFQAVLAVRERNGLRTPGRLGNELMEWKYDLIQLKALMMQTLREIGVLDMLLDGVHTEFTRRIDAAFCVDECRSLAEEMVRQFCGMNRLKEIYGYSVLVQKIILAVDMNLCQKLTLKYFSECLNVNASYLSDLFRREVGMTLTEYVTSKRMERAASLLLSSREPIKIVAKQVGISDVQYFNRLFKKRMGQTPSAYRADRGK